MQQAVSKAKQCDHPIPATALTDALAQEPSVNEYLSKSSFEK